MHLLYWALRLWWLKQTNKQTKETHELFPLIKFLFIKDRINQVNKLFKYYYQSMIGCYSFLFPLTEKKFLKIIKYIPFLPFLQFNYLFQLMLDRFFP